MKLQLKTFSTDSNTLGFMKFGGLFSCYTLELPWLDNENEISCIPAGTYECEKHVSPTHGECISVKDVPGRTHILIHKGNYTRNTLGCILVGKSIADIDNDRTLDVTSSGATLKKLMDTLPAKFQLEIVRAL